MFLYIQIICIDIIGDKSVTTKLHLRTHKPEVYF